MSLAHFSQDEDAELIELLVDGAMRECFFCEIGGAPQVNENNYATHVVKDQKVSCNDRAMRYWRLIWRLEARFRLTEAGAASIADSISERVEEQ